VTIVAAWMSADTGVGPAIASPSQACSGNCADLPHAASSRHSPMAVAVPWESEPTASSDRVVPKSSAPVFAKSSAMAAMSPMSPMRFMTNAFFAATAFSRAEGRPVSQNPMSR